MKKIVFLLLLFTGIISSSTDAMKHRRQASRVVRLGGRKMCWRGHGRNNRQALIRRKRMQGRRLAQNNTSKLHKRYFHSSLQTNKWWSKEKNSEQKPTDSFKKHMFFVADPNAWSFMDEQLDDLLVKFERQLNKRDTTLKELIDTFAQIAKRPELNQFLATYFQLYRHKGKEEYFHYIDKMMYSSHKSKETEFFNRYRDYKKIVFKEHLDWLGKLKKSDLLSSSDFLFHMKKCFYSFPSKASISVFISKVGFKRLIIVLMPHIVESLQYCPIEKKEGSSVDKRADGGEEDVALFAVLNLNLMTTINDDGFNDDFDLDLDLDFDCDD